jgi:hypothetical protein
MSDFDSKIGVYRVHCWKFIVEAAVCLKDIRELD